MPEAVRPRAVIAEDEPELAEELREQLQQLWPELEISAIVADGVRALRAVETHAPDVLFLDIQMPEATGMDVAHLTAGRCQVVFVTAYDEHAVQAFEQGAVDYVLKPITTARLLATVQRLRARMGQAPPGVPDLSRLMAGRAGEGQYLRWINASRGAEIQLVTTDEVCYFRAEDKYTVVYTEKDEALIRKPLKELVQRLDPAVFWQIHRSTVVNANAIAGVTRDLRGRLQVRLKRRPEQLAVAESCEHLFRAS